MNPRTFNSGDKVIVNLSGAGKGYQFYTIKNSFSTNNCNGYDDYNYNFEENEELRIHEYYIRKADKKDFKFKEMYDEQKISEFDIDDDKIKYTFWDGEKENIKKAVGFINKFFYPYLKEFKHSLPVSKINDWDSYYKKGFKTKNEYIFIIPHDHLNIIVVNGTTWIDLIITAPYGYMEEFYNNPKRHLGVYAIAVQYSDEEYTEVMVQVVKDIIQQYEKGIVEEHYHIDIPYELGKKLSYKRSFTATGTSDDRHNSIPEIYTRFMFDLSCFKHYFFSSKFD